MKYICCFLIISFIFLTPICSAEDKANLPEGSVDACALLSTKDFKKFLKTSASSQEKGSIPVTSGSSCFWKFENLGVSLKLSSHTKYAEQTYLGLKKRFSNAKDHPEIGDMVYESDNKFYMLKRGVYLTFEVSGQPLKTEQISGLLCQSLNKIDEIGKLSEPVNG